MTKKEIVEKAHLSLYRKYRPETFADIFGQDHVVSVLKQSVQDGNIGHAYLFHGSRGTGKTSIARIFARAIGTTPNDLYEIDAASNTSVDDIRTLSEAVHTVPLESKYKVYILDEVHMLSKAAFNAFLKTLEEPPQHVIFILATTEIEKIPETVLSRCEVYTFKKPTVDMLGKLVKKVSKSEGVTIEDKAADLVALLGDGSFRDTLSTLQKVISASKTQEVSRELVEEITNAPKSELVFGFTLALLEKKGEPAIKSLHGALQDSVDMKLFSKLCLERLRTVLLSQISGAGMSDVPANIPAAHTAVVIQKILAVQHQIGKTYIPILPLEVVVGEVCL